MSDVLQVALAVAAAAVAGAINAVAGGGTLLTFPALIGLGVEPLTANATSTVALWPGAVGSMWSYRRELAGARSWAARFALPSLAGGALGAWLLLRTPPARFAALVPWLVLGATALFMAQPLLTRALERRGVGGAGQAAGNDVLPSSPPVHVLAYQFCVGIYGGYFGAGVGILMLAVLGFMGLRNIHRMNGLKNWGGLCMNAVAALTFATRGIVHWPIALAMALGSAIGGYATAGFAQRVPQPMVRQAVVVIGIASGLWLLARR